MITPAPEVLLVLPKPLFSLKMFLRNNFSYPYEAFKKNMQGSVTVQYTIDSLGKLVNLHSIESSHSIFVIEVYRVLKEMPKWEPGSVNGKLACITSTQSISFSTKKIRDISSAIQRQILKENNIGFTTPAYVRYSSCN